MQQLKTFNVTFSTLRSSQKFMADARETLNGRLPFVTISSTVELQSDQSCYYFGGGSGTVDEDGAGSACCSLGSPLFHDSLQNSSAAMWRRILCSRNTYFDAYLLMSQLTKFERESCKLQNVTCIHTYMTRSHLKSKNVDNSHLKRR